MIADGCFNKVCVHEYATPHFAWLFDGIARFATDLLLLLWLSEVGAMLTMLAVVVCAQLWGRGWLDWVRPLLVLSGDLR